MRIGCVGVGDGWTVDAGATYRRFGPAVCEGGRHSWGASAATALSFPFPSLLGAGASLLLSSLASQSRSTRGGRYAPHNLSRGLVGHRTCIW